MGHLMRSGEAHWKHSTKCIQGTTIILLWLVRQIQHLYIFFLYYFTLMSVFMHSCSILSNLSLL